MGGIDDPDMGGVHAGVADEFATYEDYLDSQISATDLYYLEDEDLARQLVELGYRGSGETLKREEFEARKKAAEQARMNKLRQTPKALASANKDVTGFPFLASLAEREEMVRNEAAILEELHHPSIIGLRTHGWLDGLTINAGDEASLEAGAGA